VKVYLDGDTNQPTLCGTGTEDYIGTAYGQGCYDNLYQGCHWADDEKLRYCFYRYHVPDPIYFHSDCRVTIQQIGCYGPESIKKMYDAGRQLVFTGPEVAFTEIEKEGLDMAGAAEAGGYGLFERERDDWSSCAYIYLDRSENDLPALAPYAERIAGLGD